MNANGAIQTDSVRSEQEPDVEGLTLSRGPQLLDAANSYW